VNASAPLISETATVGSQLSASVGVWSGNPTSYTVRWQYCTADMSSCADIVGYAGSVYTAVPDDAAATADLVGNPSLTGHSRDRQARRAEPPRVRGGSSTSAISRS